jgi:hypothetical protein
MAALWGGTLLLAGGIDSETLVLTILLKLALLGAFTFSIFVLLRRHQSRLSN